MKRRGEGVGRLLVLDQELRQVSALVGHDSLYAGVCKRPTFAHDQNLLASFGGQSGAKLWDLRTGRPTLTVQGSCKYAVPISSQGVPFLATSCYSGVGTRIWDLRMHRPLYALPSAPEKFVWMPDAQCLLMGDGSMWRFGCVEDDWMRKPDTLTYMENATWGKLKKKRDDPGGDCCIM